MKILVLSWRDSKHPLAGGAEQVMHQHMKAWVHAGHKVTFFSSRMKGLSEKETIDGVEIIRQGYQYLGVQIAGLFFYLSHKNQFDFVVDQFHGIPFFTSLYVRKPKLAVIQEPAKEVWLVNPLPIPLNWIVGLIGYIGEPFVFLLYRKIKFMTGSESAKNELIKLLIPKENITIVPHGVILKKPPGGIGKEKAQTIIYLGVLSKDKGIEDALKCFKILNQSGVYKFWVVGKFETAEFSKKISSLVSDLGLRNKVKFWGGRDKINDLKKFELLKRAHIMVNPSIREGWGLVNIEANSVGTPVVGYKSSGLVDSIKDGISGVLCKENTPQAMAYEIANLFADRSKYEKLSKGAIAWSKNFSWTKSTKLSLTLIEGIAKVLAHEQN